MKCHNVYRIILCLAVELGLIWVSCHVHVAQSLVQNMEEMIESVGYPIHQGMSVVPLNTILRMATHLSQRNSLHGK